MHYLSVVSARAQSLSGLCTVRTRTTSHDLSGHCTTSQLPLYNISVVSLCTTSQLPLYNISVDSVQHLSGSVQHLSGLCTASQWPLHNLSVASPEPLSGLC